MKRLFIDKVIKSCGDCVYCEYNTDYNLSYDSGYDCMNEDSTQQRIVDYRHIGRNSDNGIAIPSWCPLSDLEGGGNEKR